MIVLWKWCNYCFIGKHDLFNERLCDKRDWQNHKHSNSLEITGCACWRTVPFIWFINWFILRPISYITWKIRGIWRKEDES